MLLDKSPVTEVIESAAASKLESSPVEVGDMQSVRSHDQYVSTIYPPNIPPEIIITENADNSLTSEQQTTAKLVNGACVHPPTQVESREHRLEDPPISGDEKSEEEKERHSSDADSESDDSSVERDTARDCLSEPIRAEIASELEATVPEKKCRSSATSLLVKAAVSTLLVLALLVLFMIFIFETSSDNLQIAKIRYSPYMQLIEVDWYRPIREKMLKATQNMQ